MKGWQKVWDACMKAARGGNDGEQPNLTAHDDKEAAKDGRDENTNN